MTLLYSCMLEGREAVYDDNRELYIEKIKMWATGKEIRESLSDQQADSAVRYFQRWKKYGMPYHDKGWGEMPLPLLEAMDILGWVYDSYNPPIRLM